jgi:hypothetical protein
MCSGRIDQPRVGQAQMSVSSQFQMRFPWDNGGASRYDSARSDTLSMTSRRDAAKTAPVRPARIQLALFAETATLIRVRPGRNEWRFYRIVW